MKYLKYICLFACLTTLISCKVQYGFTQPSSTDAETFQVNYFQNNAPLIEPGVERDFKIALEELIINQTSLTLVKSNADIIYEGEIVEYRISPTTATANNTAAQNRLTIGVKVHFYDKTDPETEFDQRFSFFYDFAGSAQLVGARKETAHTEIFERLTQDIINASIGKW